MLVVVRLAAADPIPAPPMLPTPPPHITFAGGDGTTCAAAITIIGASHETEGIRAERWWIYSKNPGARVANRRVEDRNGKDLESFEIVTAAGAQATVCFDITSFYGKP